MPLNKIEKKLHNWILRTDFTTAAILCLYVAFIVFANVMVLLQALVLSETYHYGISCYFHHREIPFPLIFATCAIITVLYSKKDMKKRHQ